MATQRNMQLVKSQDLQFENNKENYNLNRIIKLITEYSNIRKEYFDTREVKIKNLLDGYKGKNRFYIDRFNSLIDGYNKTLIDFRESQRLTAEDVNILDVLDFTYDEVRHSKFLAYLFDPLETHAQGNLFFKIFLKETNLPLEYCDSDYRVYKEVSNDKSRIDIEILSKKSGENGFIIHIENKVRSVPTKEQIERENKDIIKTANEKNIKNRHAFLLSLKNEIELEETIFKWIGWDKIEKCLEIFIKEAKAERVKWMAEQYLDCIRKNIIKEMNKEVEVVEYEETKSNRSLSS